MQQRVQIARCLAQQPKIMLMDEPFGALDAITRQTLQDELLAIAAERRMTVVFITHDLEEAIYLGDRVIVLGTNPGHIAERSMSTFRARAISSQPGRISTFSRCGIVCSECCRGIERCSASSAASSFRRS